jgi:orotate phosphoribosyltransferase
MLSQDAIMDEFREAGALLEGHFILSSGLHSRAYLQCARVLMEPARAGRLCRDLAQKLASAGLLDGVSMVVSPAMGGVIAGYELARALGLPAVFFERVAGVFDLRRGFHIQPGQACLLMEDVVTTGLSSRECIKAAADMGGIVTAAAALVDRSGGRANLGVPFLPLLTLDIPIFTADSLPADLAALPAVKPGSRNLQA